MMHLPFSKFSLWLQLRWQAACCLLLCLSLGSCEKQYLEVIPVLLTEDISVPTGVDILQLDFPTDAIGYAAGDTGVIFKTTDGGASWTSQKVADVSNSSKCRGLVFFDAEHGLCVFNGQVYHTTNGGQSWSYKAPGSAVGMGEEGEGYLAAYESYSRVWTIMRSTDKGTSFNFAQRMQQGNDFRKISFKNSHFLFIPREDNWVYWIDLETGENGQSGLSDTNAYTRPTDMYVYQQQGAVVGSGGNILQQGSLSYSRVHYAHNYDYRAIDGYRQQAIAVGVRSIAVNSNIGEYQHWQELFAPDGSSFPQTFTQIKATGANNFYIGGERGLLWRAQF